MGETERIVDQLQRSLEGHAWHGPSVLELLSTVNATQALAKPVPDLHSIWELVAHMTAWQDVVRRRLAGEVIHDLPPEQNFPRVGRPDQAAWERAVHDFRESCRALQESIRALADTDLDLPLPGKKYNRYVTLHGVVQHNLYHAGQIAFLRKMIRP